MFLGCFGCGRVLADQLFKLRGDGVYERGLFEQDASGDDGAGIGVLPPSLRHRTKSRTPIRTLRGGGQSGSH
jgi:hypothetical protein